MAMMAQKICVSERLPCRQMNSNYLNVETTDKVTGNGIQLAGYLEERIKSTGRIKAIAVYLVQDSGISLFGNRGIIYLSKTIVVPI